MTTAPYLPAQPPAAAVFSAGPMLEDERNRMAVQGLLADGDRALALTELDDVRGNREIVEDAIANARQNYIDLVRRHRRLSFSDGEQTAIQQTLDCLRARLHFFGAPV